VRDLVAWSQRAGSVLQGSAGTMTLPVAGFVECVLPAVPPAELPALSRVPPADDPALVSTVEVPPASDAAEVPPTSDVAPLATSVFG
jgi:hypothetical protein